jgi:predicted nuclease with TOPRIM domain
MDEDQELRTRVHDLEAEIQRLLARVKELEEEVSWMRELLK